MSDPLPPQASRLVNDLSYLPSILGRMGLSIAEAQDELNQGYVEALASVVKLLGTLGYQPPPPDGASGTATLATQIKDLIGQLAPCRYQFTETTFDFSADLAESYSSGKSGDLKIGTKAIAVNASLTSAFSYDYRAAARITCTLRADPVGAGVVGDLLKSAQINSGEANKLPDGNAPREATTKLITAINAALKETSAKQEDGKTGV